MSDYPQIRIERAGVPFVEDGVIEAHQAALAGLSDDARQRIEDLQREVGMAVLFGTQKK